MMPMMKLSCGAGGRLVVARMMWRNPCMHVPEGEAWGLFQALEFVASYGYKWVVFEIDSKCV